MTHKKLQQKLDRLEASKADLLTKLDHCDPFILYFKPAPDKWCIPQVIYHLNYAEALSIQYVSKKMLGGTSVKKSGIATNLRSLYLRSLLRSGYKWKAPAM